MSHPSSPLVRSAGSESRSSSIAANARGRQPSVGEVYQEMEQEQEAQVNRLLQTIRLQQTQIQALQSRSDDAVSEGSPLFGATNVEHIVPHSPVPISERNRRLSQISPAPVRSVPTGFQLSQSLSHEQENAVLSSGRVTPALPTPASSVSGAVRDEVAFYQAENHNLTREIQTLRARIRELEQQIPTSHGPSNDQSVPTVNSRLSQEESTNEDGAALDSTR